MQQAQRDKILIARLLVLCIIGVTDWERHAPQDVTFNIEAVTNTRPAALINDLSDSADNQMIHGIRALA
jgi:FolB domain-containing protein